MIRAGASPGCTSRFWIAPSQATFCAGSCGPRTETVPPSTGCAVPAPYAWLIAVAMRVAVVKSAVLRLSIRSPPPANEEATTRSTEAPLGMRPLAEMFTCTLEPLLPCALMPPTTTLPCATA